MRLASLVLATSVLALSVPALAQSPVPGMLPEQGGAGPAAPTAGQEPTLGQQPNSVIPGGSGGAEPSRAPGSAADQGNDLPKTDADSGTTTSYAPSAGAAQDVPWPCVQPKVPTISAGTIWTGPNVAEGKDWDEDNTLAELAQKLASRRTTLDEANDMIVAFAKGAGANKDKKLTALFVGTLDIINGNRSEILEGITRYARGQERLAERMRTESDKISMAQEDATAHDLGLATAQTNTDFAWDQRIFKERKQALSYVCETPSILERRAYEIAKKIQAQL